MNLSPEQERATESCLRGHPRDEENLYISPKGSRQCRACARIRTRNYRKKHGMLDPNKIFVGRVRLQVVKLENSSPGKKLCHVCRNLRPDTKEFFSPRVRECRSCRSERSKSMSDPERIGNLVAQARARARKRGTKCTLVVSDIVVPAMCPVFGFPLRWGTRQQRDHSPSIDLLDRNGDYTPNNILVVSWLANNIRGKFTVDQLRAVTNFYDDLFSRTN